MKKSKGGKAKSADTGTLSRIVGEGRVDPVALAANPLNWRIHPYAQQEALSRVLGKVGWVQRVLVNKPNNRIIDGHLRVKMAVDKGELEIPVVYVDLTEEEEKLVLATYDSLGMMAKTDSEVLGELLGSMDLEFQVVTNDLAARLASELGSGSELMFQPNLEPTFSEEVVDEKTVARAAKKLAEIGKQDRSSAHSKVICPACGLVFYLDGKLVAEMGSADEEKKSSGAPSWRDRIVGSGSADPAELLENPLNWRRHEDDQILAMSRVLDRIGWVQGVVVNQTTGRVVDGHLRVHVAKLRGETAIPVVYVELSEEEERAVLATFDTIGSMAYADFGVLGELSAGALMTPEMEEALRSMVSGDVRDWSEGSSSGPVELEAEDYTVLCPGCGEVVPAESVMDGAAQ